MTLNVLGEKDTAWSVVARNTKREQQSSDTSNKKLDTKRTPPRPESPLISKEKSTVATKPSNKEHVLDEKDFPLLSPPKKFDKTCSVHTKSISTDDDSKPPFTEGDIDSKDISLSSKTCHAAVECENKKVVADSLEPRVITDESPISFFSQSFPENYPPDWKISPANNYIIPDPNNIDAVDSSLAIENER
jgi:hypothetical protein